MADKAITELIEATQVTSTDQFVLEQSGTAKRLTGQTLINFLLKAIDGHGGIQSLVKSATSGLTDTYRMTLADGTTQDIVVTNGRGISSITQTASSGLKDTYTIKYNDGTSSTFTINNGRTISSIKETSVTGLTRTYTILFNDGTSETFDITDGRSVTKIEKTGSSGLVDTYTITYNDGTSGTFAVTNGAKGDKGDSVYLWIKYAAQEPTADSHSFGDLPDNWMGVYSGSSASAPTDWTQYAWFEIKGKKGDTGDAATLLSSAVEYQASESGTIIPSGVWGTSVPVVAQGKYMWTRTTLTYNTGNPVISYSVARMGIDGSGSVSSVNGVSPDPEGNVKITPGDVGALPITGGAMEGPINMQGQQLTGLNSPSNESEAATKGYVDNMAPTYSVASTLETLTSGEKLSVSMGKIMKAITDLISHIGNKSNPHSVTKAQVGLSNVPNVATNDQTPTYSAASTLATLSSGEKLTVSLGKIMKAITDLISHLANKSNPHGVTASQLSSGTLPSARLPTIPVDKGGTDATDAATARSNLEITPANIGALPTSKIIAVVKSLTFTEGIATYENSAILSGAVSFAQFRASQVSTLADSVLATYPSAGSIKIVSKMGQTGALPVLILVINP